MAVFALPPCGLACGDFIGSSGHPMPPTCNAVTVTVPPVELLVTRHAAKSVVIEGGKTSKKASPISRPRRDGSFPSPFQRCASQHDIRSAATHAESRTATTRNRRLIISASAKSNATPWLAMANERSTRHKRKFGIGFVLGYGIRELISRRRRSQYLRDTLGLK
jgi:hypothetical protein